MRTIIFDHGYSLHTCVLRPKSRGYIGLHSKNPLAHPLIEPNYLSCEEDLDCMLKGLKRAIKVNIVFLKRIFIIVFDL